MFSQEAARQTEISPHVYQGELPVIRPSPHYQSNIGQDLWNWWPFGAGRYCVYWSQTFLTCQRHAFVNSPHSKLSLTNRGKEVVFPGLGRAWGPVFAYYWYLWICQVVIFFERFIKIYLSLKKLLKMMQTAWALSTSSGVGTRQKTYDSFPTSLPPSNVVRVIYHILQVLNCSLSQKKAKW